MNWTGLLSEKRKDKRKPPWSRCNHHLFYHRNPLFWVIVPFRILSISGVPISRRRWGVYPRWLANYQTIVPRRNAYSKQERSSQLRILREFVFLDNRWWEGLRFVTSFKKFIRQLEDATSRSIIAFNKSSSLLVMIPPISWLDILFFGIFLLPNLVLQLPVKDFLVFCFLAIPYGIPSFE